MMIIKYSNQEILESEHYMMLSGGFDSTYLAIELLEMQKQGKIKKPINLIYNDTQWIESLKREKEKDAIKQLLEIFKSKGYKFKFFIIKTDLSAIDHEDKTCFGEQERVGYFQQFLFVSQLIPVMAKKSILHFSYIKQDGNTYLEALKNIFKGIDQMNDGETKLSFPIINMLKNNIIGDIIRFDPKLLNILWTCENPIKDKKQNILPCKNCEKCKELYYSLQQIDTSCNKIKRDFYKIQDRVSKQIVYVKYLQEQNKLTLNKEEECVEDESKTSGDN